MAFDEEQFPTDISRGATARPRRVVDVVTLRSGHEQRNTIWANSRRTYDVSLGLRELEDVYDLIEFWEARRGRLRGFRFKDWADFTSVGPNTTPSNADQAMASITSTTYQLQKVYSPASNPWTRTIYKPVNGTVLIRDNTGSLTEGVDWTMDYTTGIATFGSAPTGTPTAGFEYDVPVRFEAEELEVNVALFDVGSVPAINLVEVRI
ncbi:glycoside hydrolase [Roseobacter phage RDJL Phi 2]|uniref:Putative glycoside hydrolase n=1 Tax=Roseobacter phage RDJL Phi 2 TaxID=1682380 RepID=A0A0K0PVL5_9CAUD|nr:glycoside hydrolase [Roseobacter phage RDJL Phi 2]AKQ75860.1 putative glycoside hydrolase [Roseobacter phage RDJL Phi 2]